MSEADSPAPDFIDALLRAALACERSGTDCDAVDSGNDPVPAAIGRFRVLERIGVGGLGEVFRVVDPTLDRVVALKVLRTRAARHSSRIEAFVTEAKIAGALEHPGIVPLHEYGTLDDGRPYFTMRVIGGRTLAAMLDDDHASSGSRMRPLETLAVVARTLAFAHARGIVHGDVKPQNVMVGEFGEVQVIDWGFARATHPIDAEAGSVAPRLLGTPAYMAPEQATGDVLSVDARTDVFGLGGILVEILTGRPPHVASTRSEVVRIATEAKQEELGERLSRADLEPRLVELARACLAADRAKRPADASVVAAELERYFEGEADRVRAAMIEVERANARAESERRARKRIVFLGIALILAIGAVALDLDARRRERASRRNENDIRAARAIEDARGAIAFASAFDNRLDVDAWLRARDAAERAVSFSSVNDCDESFVTKAREMSESTEREVARVELANRTLRRVETLFHRLLDDRDAARLESEFAATFRDHGIDLSALSVEEAAELVRSDLLCDTLVAALDHWSRMRRSGPGADPGAGHDLLAIAIASDPDPWRKEVREAIRARDVTALEALAERGVDVAGSAASCLLIGQALVDLGRRTRALAFFESAVLRHPYDYWLCHGYASELGTADEHETAAALRLYSMAHSLRPDDAHVLVDLARVYAIRKEPGKATDLLERAVVLDPDSARAWTFLGTTLEIAGERAKSRDALLRALELGASAAGLLLSDQEVAAGRIQSAVERIRGVFRAFPTEPVIAVAFARLAIDVFAQADAAAALDVVLRSNPHHPEASLLRAYCRLRLLDPERAVAELETVRAASAVVADERLSRMADSMLAEARKTLEVKRILESNPGAADDALHGERVSTGDVFSNLLALVTLDRPVAAMRTAEVLLSRPGADRGFGLRFTAARAAARLAIGEGADAGASTVFERTAALHHAADWLDADLTAIEAKLDSGEFNATRVRSLVEVWVLEPSFLRLIERTRSSSDEASVAWNRTWEHLRSLRERVDGGD